MSHVPHVTHRLDVVALMCAVDAQRRRHRMSWRDVAGEIGGCSPAMFTKMRNGQQHSLHADVLVSILAWLGRDALIRDFMVVVDQDGMGQPLAVDPSTW